MKSSNPLAVSINEPCPRPVSASLMLTAVLFLALGTAGCSSSSTSTEVADDAGVNLADAVIAYEQPAPLQALQDDVGRISAVPAIIDGQIMAETGLEVAYTDNELVTIVPAQSIENNWVHMQSCLNQVSVAPLVVVTKVVSPLTIHDDVIHTIDGYPFASASYRDVPILQIDSEDFEPDRIHGYNLRSIMGRLLWSSAGLAVRDYPFDCANQIVENK